MNDAIAHPRRQVLTLFVKLSLAFLLAGVAGCLLHECGHAIVAKGLGNKQVSVHYAYMYPGYSAVEVSLTACAAANAQPYRQHRIVAGHPCYPLQQAFRQRSNAITAGGPIANLLIGTVAFAAMLYRRRTFQTATRLRPAQWLLVLAAFFWSRQLLNLAIGLFSFLASGRFGSTDEARLSAYFGWPRATLDVAAGTTALVLLSIVTFGFVPARERFPFIAAGLVGSALFAYLWLYQFGPVLLP